MKNNILKLKDDIKKLVLTQKQAKVDRKTINHPGGRVMKSYEAAYSVPANRFKLRHMYLAYAIIRGKDIGIVETYSKTPYNQKIVDGLVNEYSDEDVCVDTE